MARIGILYKVEELIRNKTPEERQKQSRPIVDELFEWMHAMKDYVDRSYLKYVLEQLRQVALFEK